MKTFRLFNKFEIKVRKSFPQLLFDYFMALFLPTVTFILASLSFPHFLSTTPTLLFIPVIMACSWNGGFVAGTIASIVSAAAINYYLPEYQFFAFVDPLRAVQFALIVVEGSFISYVISLRRREEMIREYKKTEREQQKKIEEILAKNLSFEKEIRSRDEFLSIASHELKTPLTSMLLQTQTALHNIRNVSVAHFSFENLLKMLESVENQTKRLSKMINDLLAVSVITTGNLNLELEEVNLDKLIKGLLDDFAAKFQKENYAIQYIPQDEIIGIWDKIRIEQALSNLLSNAIKYGEHKPIVVQTKTHKHSAEISIIDHGIGISKNNQKHIFELFQRAVSPEKYKGLGVGLYITQKIITSHGGTIEIFSSQNSGSKFTIKLPLNKTKK